MTVAEPRRLHTDDKCATCGHEAGFHWVRIIAPLDGECDRGDCACARFVAGRDASDNIPPGRDHSGPSGIGYETPYLDDTVWPETAVGDA